MQECIDCGYMMAGYDGYCERCAALRAKPAASRKAHYRNRSLDDIRIEESSSERVKCKLPPDEPRVAVSHDDYLEFLRRMQTRPMTEGEVAELVIRRLERVAVGDTLPDELVHEIKELHRLSEAWLTEAQVKRIYSLVMKHASRWVPAAAAET